MYDPLTSTYSLASPHGRHERVALSGFRAVESLPGAVHPALYRVSFACSCGDEHDALLTQTDLDWAPLGTEAGGVFFNLVTRRPDSLAAELGELAVTHIRVGEWPWSFYCFLEAKSRPVTPSAFAAIAPSEGSYGVAVRCPVCSSLSVNLVSRDHLDVPFRNDARVGVVDHVFRDDAIRALDAFRAELASAHFDQRRIDLEA